MKPDKTLLLSQSDVSSLLGMEAAISAIEAAFAAHGRGEAQMPPKVYLALPAHDGDLQRCADLTGASWAPGVAFVCGAKSS